MKKRFLLLAAVLIICVAALAMPASAASCDGDHGDGWQALTADDTTLSTGSYYLSDDVTATYSIAIDGEVTLCLNGHVLNLNGNRINVSGSGNSLTLCDCNGSTPYKFTVGEDGLWKLDETEGTETITGGVITGGKSYDDGDGGGVRVYSGTFNMESGSIVGNKSDRYGGGVYVQSGTFNMYGGSIVGNTARSWGGGVYVCYGSTFTMSGGSISENTTRLSGGGVYVDGGAFNMSGGSISENTATNDGGGVSVAGTFTMESGSISGNTASRSGGGVYVYSGTFTMSGNASISENTATNDGGGVYAGYDGTFTMSGGSISENAATNTGGGVRVYDGTFNMSGGSISENTATNGGGGVFLVDDVNYPPVLKLGGAPEIDGDIWLGGTPIEITAALSNTEPFQLTNVDSQFTTNWNTYMQGKDPAKYFSIDKTDCHIGLSYDGEVIVLADTYGVTLNTNGGAINGGNITSYTCGVGTPLPTDVTRTGYTFDGWYASADFSGEPVTEITAADYGNKEFWAKWTANTYTVTLHTDEGAINGGDIKSYTYGVGAVLPTDVERSGYRFDGWYASADFSGEPVTEITAADYGNKEFWAKWTRKASSPSYKVTVKDSDGGSVTATPGSASKGLTITVKIKPDEGYTLDTLTVTDASGNKLELFKRSDTEYSFSMPGSAVTVKATFDGEEAPVATGFPFVDVDIDDWFYPAVEYVYENELMNGVADDEFDPNATLTRGMMATLLWRLEGESVVNYLMPFDDVDEASWYGEAVRWAASEGIVTGVSENSYAPNDPITREQLAAILYRYAVYKDLDVSVGEDTNILSYADFAEISEYAIPAIQWATGSGLMRGVTDSELSPQGTATRAQIATMMMRFIENI